MTEKTLTPDGAKQIGQSDKAQGKERADTQQSPPAQRDAYNSGYDNK